MSEQIIFVDTSEVREGELEELRRGVRDLAGFVEARETDPISYEIYSAPTDRVGRSISMFRASLFDGRRDRVGRSNHPEPATRRQREPEETFQPWIPEAEVPLDVPTHAHTDGSQSVQLRPRRWNPVGTTQVREVRGSMASRVGHTPGRSREDVRWRED